MSAGSPRLADASVMLAWEGGFRLDDDQVSDLGRRFPSVRFATCDGRTVGREELDPFDAAVGWVPYGALTAERLRWLQLPSVGIDRFLKVGPIPDGLLLTNARGIFGVPAAEHALALALALCRELPRHIRQMQTRTWARHDGGREVYGSKVVVVGMGDIGGEVARRFALLGATVVGVRRGNGEVPPFVDAVHTPDALPSVVGDADFVVLALPGTAATRGIFDRACIEAMRPGSILINVGRGDTHDEDALVEALASGHLGGAGLDVTAVEPLAADSPLWSMEQVVVTSHSVGVSPRRVERFLELVDRNLTRFLAGKPLENVVDLEAGY